MPGRRAAAAPYYARGHILTAARAADPVFRYIFIDIVVSIPFYPISVLFYRYFCTFYASKFSSHVDSENYFQKS
jgi:hypothetical protein